jgi:hypothetical protein
MINPKIVHLSPRPAIDRREAWRQYERSKLCDKIILATRTHPPPGWDAMFGDDYLPPAEGWSPWWDENGQRRQGIFPLWP